MYAIKYYDSIIYGDKLQDIYPVTSATLDMEVNTAGSLKVVIPPTHPAYDVVDRLKMGFTVEKNGATIFKGQMLTKPVDFNKNATLEVEGKLACLNDSIFRPTEFGGTPEDYFAAIINNHNLQAPDEKQFKIGTLTGANLDDNDYIYRKLENYSTSWDLIKRLIQNVGGYVYVRYEDDGDYIDWVDGFSYANSQQITFAENLLDLTDETSAEETYSACIPTGHQDETTKEYLTVASVNSGSDIVTNASRVEEIGLRFAPPDKVHWNDVTVASNLLTKAQEWLSDTGIFLKETLSLSAVDLAYADASVDSFDIQKYIQVTSTPHNLSKNYLLTKLSIDFLHPENTKITLGESKQTLYDVQVKTDRAIAQVLERTEQAQTSANQASAEAQQVRTDAYAQISQTESDIMSSVSETYVTKTDHDQTTADLRSSITQTADGIRAEVSTLLTTADEHGTALAEQRKWVQFDDNGLTIGQDGAEITSNIDNDSYEFINKSGDTVLSLTEWGTDTPSAWVHTQLRLLDHWAIREGQNGNLNDSYLP